MRIDGDSNNVGSHRNRIVLGGPRQSEFSDSSEGWPISRHHLSFDEVPGAASERMATTRRRVFARLASPAHVELSLNDRDESQSDDSNRVYDWMASRQMILLPPTPPRRRTAESDVEEDLEPYANNMQDVVLPGQRHAWETQQRRATGTAELAESAEPNAAEQTLPELERFAQLRRQRFLQEQRLRMDVPGSRQPTENTSDEQPYALGSASMPPQADWTQQRSTMTAPDVTAASSAAEETPGARVAFWQQFPSNDVDSYWYNQPDAAENSGGAHTAAAAATPGGHSDGNRRTVSLRRLGHLPAIARNSAAEQSRQVMLDVIRMHGLSFSSNNSDDDDSDEEMMYGVDGGSSARIRQRQQQQQHQGTAYQYAPMRMQHPSWLAAAMDMRGRREKPDQGGAAPADSQRTQNMKALAEKQLQQWLVKHTVPARALDCSLLRPGIEFCGEQRISMDVQSSGLNPNPRVGRRPLEVERWNARVVIQSVDMERGRIFGTMESIDVPWMLSKTAVVTRWEGEIIDFVNYTPLTGKWKAKCKDDTEHWSMFDPVKSQPQTFLSRWPGSLCGKRMPQILEDYIFMRWKDTEFVNVQPNETRLTIMGFYYICMNRRTGEIEGKTEASLISGAMSSKHDHVMS
ncbi:hypothetical protein FB645_004382 [Coemansia sp. IMI 203386]|nr:hypothetical protein FB645_004382 [Coemansia sp. IMI 203386]